MEDRLTFGKQMCLFEILPPWVFDCQNHSPYPNQWIKQANMPQASQFTGWHLSMKQPSCVCLSPGLLGCLWLRYVLLSGRLGRNNLAEKCGLWHYSTNSWSQTFRVRVVLEGQLKSLRSDISPSIQPSVRGEDREQSHS